MGSGIDSNAVKSALLCVIYCSILQHLKVEQSLPWESNSCSGIPRIPCMLWNAQVPYHADTSPPLVPIMSPLSSSFFLILSSSVWLHLPKRYSMHTRYNLLVDFYWEVMKENWRWLTNKFRYMYFFFVYQPWFYYCHGQGHCATSRKVAGLIPDVVTGTFDWHNLSGCTMALGLTQPLIEMSARNISWEVKAASA